MKVLKAIGLILFLIPMTWAQGPAAISGKVLVDQTPVEVTVVLTREGKEIARAVSNAQGVYRFDRVPNGSYVLGVELQTDGRLTLINEREVSVSEGAGTIVVDFALRPVKSTAQPSPIIRETVNVAADASQPVEQIAKTVDVIDAQQMRDRADF